MIWTVSNCNVQIFLKNYISDNISWLTLDAEKMSLGGVKLKTKLPTIPGTKPSLRNSQLLISSGIPSLDSTIGGGLPIGSIFLIGMYICIIMFL